MTSQSPRLPSALYRADQVRELDRIAIEDCGIEGFALMHKAASVAFGALLEKWPHARHLLIFVGSGNNGGDGNVLAGLAKDYGLNPELITLGDHSKLQGDALRARDFATQRNITVGRFDRATILGTGSFPTDHTVIVDALLGTGIDRPVSNSYAEAINTINDLPFPVLAVDIPSGLSSDTGAVLGVAVRADLTTTFIGMKQGLLTGAGVDVTGQLVYNALDVPEQVFSAANSPAPASRRLCLNQISRLLRPRLPSANKGLFGHTVVVGGDYGYGGAILMAASAALRAGSGLVSVVTRSVNRAGFLAGQPEIMLAGTEDPEEYEGRITDLFSRASVIVAGPGLGKSAWSRDMLDTVLQYRDAHGVPLVIDADGLNLLAETGNANTSSSLARDNWILTPHPGEAARLLRCETAEINADRFAAVRHLQDRWGGVVLLKGAGSLICSGQREQQVIELCDAGNPGMASGGMGDVLSGLIGGLVAQHYSLADSMRLAVCIHGEAADQIARCNGQRGLAATDLLPAIHKLVNPDL